MADTPILNYKGKYDGPEIDKAIELALGLDNPKSCPYYVHVSLSKPDYVLTIGLGDAEGNLFNHAEIDLPLESMVVNATYENGNIILHLQDGTSTEPIPISALIAGLVSETRTIAGIDLKDDITPKELRDALDVYTKDSVDQLVSDLENRIDETLNEMEQSLNDLSDLTSEHDRQIKKNTSDIAINHTTLGTQCKNILKNTSTTVEYKGVTYTINADGSITANGATGSETSYFNFKEYFEISKPAKYTLSGCPSGGSQSTWELQLYKQKQGSNDVLTLDDYGAGVDKFNTKELDAGMYRGYIAIRPNQTIDNLTFYPMLRYADITDPTYEPYKPSVNERLTANESDILIVNSLVVYCKNLIPQDIAIGYYADSTGAPTENTAFIRAVNYPKVKPNVKYTMSSNLPIYSVWYFNGDTAISRENIKETTRTITIPENCNNIRISLQKTSSSSGTSEFKWLQVEEGEVATEFTPYVPSLQNQINALVERIAALETAQTQNE